MVARHVSYPTLDGRTTIWRLLSDPCRECTTPHSTFSLSPLTTLPFCLLGRWSAIRCLAQGIYFKLAYSMLYAAFIAGSRAEFRNADGASEYVNRCSEGFPLEGEVCHTRIFICNTKSNSRFLIYTEAHPTVEFRGMQKGTHGVS